MGIRPLCSLEGCDKPHLALGYCEPHYRRFKKHGDPLLGGAANGDLAKWIDEVALPFNEDGCLIWPFGRHKDGYAQGSYPGIATKHACRAVCELSHGEPPTPEHEAAHSCGNGTGGCINPRHLSWKTHVENEADKVEHGTLLRGSRHTNARLTESDVREVRSLFGSMTHEKIAERFGVSRATISLIASGATWGWLE